MADPYSCRLTHRDCASRGSSIGRYDDDWEEDSPCGGTVNVDHLVTRSIGKREWWKKAVELAGRRGVEDDPARFPANEDVGRLPCRSGAQ
eukprot:scaffold30485_cov24-Tisochrysis_lutea.AAC.4